MAKHLKLAIVTSGIAGCAVALRASQKGFANDNHRPVQPRNIAYLAVAPKKDDSVWPEGLRLHTAVLMNVARGETLVKVTYPIAG